MIQLPEHILLQFLLGGAALLPSCFRKRVQTSGAGWDTPKGQKTRQQMKCSFTSGPKIFEGHRKILGDTYLVCNQPLEWCLGGKEGGGSSPITFNRLLGASWGLEGGRKQVARPECEFKAAFCSWEWGLAVRRCLPSEQLMVPVVCRPGEQPSLRAGSFSAAVLHDVHGFAASTLHY